MAGIGPKFLLGVAGALLTATAVSGLAQEREQAGSTDSFVSPSQAERAYVPPSVAEPPLPSFPLRPAFDGTAYPDCREDYRKIAAPFDKAADVNRCTALIDSFYNDVMLPYREAMAAYQNQLSTLYADEVGGNRRYSSQTQDRFYRTVMTEHAASSPDGDHLADWRAAEARYKADRTYLTDRFCFNTGCGGYPVPPYAVAARDPDAPPSDRAKKPKADDAATDAKCKRARKRGSGIGGLLGGIAGSAAGLKGVGTAIAGVFGAVLVGEIACQLDEKEQEKAAEATIAVTRKEEVGAVATWQSPTREGVSGSSTVTALAAEPNGSKCLTITDVAIIDGEETRVSKQMCRKRGDERYTLRA